MLVNANKKRPTLRSTSKGARPRSLADWRGRLGLSQRAAAEALGISLRAYQELERGAEYGSERTRTPDRRTLLACAAILAGIAPLTIGNGGP